MIREDGNVIYAAFSRAAFELHLTASTEIVFEDEYLIVFRIVVEIGGKPALLKHIVVAADEPA